MAVVNLRLETLPWVARAMARNRPDSSLKDAIGLARRTVAARPIREDRIIPVKCLRADGQNTAPEPALEAAHQAKTTFPRDAASDPALERQCAAPQRS